MDIKKIGSILKAFKNNIPLVTLSLKNEMKNCRFLTVYRMRRERERESLTLIPIILRGREWTTMA
jgi:hypothetical protein